MPEQMHLMLGDLMEPSRFGMALYLAAALTIIAGLIDLTLR